MPRPAVTRGGLPASDPMSGAFFTNATLLTITAPGEPDRNGDPGDGMTLWEGEAGGYLTRINSTMLVAGVQTAVKLDVFQILASISAPILEVAGPDWEATTITVEDRRIAGAPVTVTFRVTRMENRIANTILDHLRLELEHGQPS